MLCGHETPDADCVGSTGALWLALRGMGKDARLVMPGGLARRLNWLVEYARLDRRTDAAALDGATLAIVCDTAKEKRINAPGGFEALQHLTILNIDHHATNTGFGAQQWIDETRSSTSEMVFELLQALHAHPTPTIATLLYAGIHSDTRGFSLANTTARSLEVAHHLAAQGAHIAEMCEAVERSHSAEEFALLRTVYGNTRTSADGRIAWSSASFDEIAASGCSADTIDDQVDIPRSIAGIRIAILFTEGEPGVVRMNFRGEGGTSVLPLAEKFGGGGHHAAAGARRRGSLSAIMKEVTDAATTYAATL